ncbi:hypothetical protein CEP54_010503 [Fusarium duplospermum]|uniref:FAD-binding domain-containing protein n=1 Tax=Fusarium duplospermum TaxID=1325734 RepID=A0A428PJR1_9HYPO|nr:hypothetical protein CEP54_010503 [Fusarium duplospermum]
MATTNDSSTPPKPLAIIVGAGLGGLAAAVAIALSGQYRVQVLEAASKLGEIGAGIQLSSNCSRLLIRWGCDKFLRDNVVAPRHGRVCRWQNGEILTDRIMNPSAEERFGAPYWHIHRADLHQALLDRAIELGADLRTNACVTKVRVGDADTSASVTLESGETLDCDLLIGADGIRSRVRNSIFPDFEAPRPTGDLAYRFRVNTADLLDDEILKPLGENPDTHSWWGPGKHIVGYMLRGKQMYNVITLFPDDGSLGDATRGTGTIEHLKEMYQGWCPQVERLINRAQESQLIKWKLMDLPPLERWNDGRCVLLGDACHPMLPYLAQGSCSAMEDAGFLAECLKHLPGRIETAAEIYSKYRKPRATKIQLFSRQQRIRNHLPDGPEQQERDAVLKNPDQQTKAHVWAWDSTDGGPAQDWVTGLHGYDAEHEAVKALRLEGLLGK